MELSFSPLLTPSSVCNSLASCMELQYQEHQWLTMLSPVESFSVLTLSDLSAAFAWDLVLSRVLCF